MRHYLIRHAHALEGEPDKARTLSGRGHRQVATLGDLLLRSSAFVPDEVWHSPLVRARETAQLLIERLQRPVPLREMRGLKPEDDPAVAAAALMASEWSIAVVGHEPHLGQLASQLLVGDPARPLILMQKCSVLAVEGLAPRWQVLWHLAPDLLE